MEQMDSFVRSLLSGDQELAWNIVLDESNNGKTSLEIYEDLVTIGMRKIGEMWENNVISVADEHLATSTCEYVLSRYRYHKENSFKPKDGRRKALFLCVENEQHSIGLKLVSLLFEEHGWESRMLGANLPKEYAIKMAGEWQPDVIGLSITIAYHTSTLNSYIETLENMPAKPTVMLGGRLTPTMNFSALCSPKTQILPTLDTVDEWLVRLQSEENVNAIR
ncbi:B12-binding domain-containing protein [Heyndrickxia acidicola]|uniref:Cobalamin-dependent protein n=1 Tax=Heyndrickxia acidicola TaxID=209389 RepID=A0ABU6MFA2_9BACI|nr:cobalamin-dependent protein [Heyndrickxia acidicola]MED1203363.1 cobalamin-dependent protein [Heyndrickxia acidicola]